MEDCEENDSMQSKRIITKNKLANIITTEDGTIHYCCIECPVRYLDKAELELHLCMHTKEYRYLCGICGKGLKRKEHLDRHTLEHKETRPHVCPECGKGFKRKEHLNIHHAVHKGDKIHSCTICYKTFSRKDHLQKHLQTHSKVFSGLDIIAHETNELDIKSEMADDDAAGESEMHYEQSQELDPMEFTGLQQPQSEVRYPCYYCEKTYKIRSHFQAHLQTHVNDETQEVPVESQPDDGEDSQWISFDGSEDPQELTQSLQSMGLLIPRVPPKPIKDPRPHCCEVCNKRFKRRQHLKVHMNVHQRLQPTIWCSLCNEGFYSNPQFENHKCSANPTEEADEDLEPVKPHSPEMNENKIPVGGIKIINAMDDPEYRLIREKESNIPVPQKVYVCKFCSKPFRRKDHFKIHQHIHTGVKSFFCDVCDKGFYRKDHLQKHSQVHQRIKQPTKKKLPGLFPISMTRHRPKVTTDVKPEITIHAPAGAALRMPLQMKVPYQVVISGDARTILPTRAGD